MSSAITTTAFSVASHNRTLSRYSSGCFGNLHDSNSEKTEDEFGEVYYLMIFMGFIWLIGKFFARLGLPSLVGEIIIGIILGPPLLDLVPDAHAMIVVGEMGLILLVLEAGIDVDIQMLKLIGPRGIYVAICGSSLPIFIGTGLSYALGNSLISSISVGAAIAPTSMGIALNVLRRAKVLNTPVGQLIIAAAVLDDIIGLILLSLLSLRNPEWYDIVRAVAVSPLLIVLFGAVALKVMPWVVQSVLSRVPHRLQEFAVLLLCFLAAFALIPICHFAGSSHLLGAFLAGLMFCKDHTIHHAWSNQMKRILHWMLRIFFAATIGFEVPVREFADWNVILRALLYSLPGLGKIVTGVFAQRPLSKEAFWTVAFAMAARGEFAFILATTAYDMGYIGDVDFAAILLAVLLSVVVSPFLLRRTLEWAQQRKQEKLSIARERREGDQPVYFCIHATVPAHWKHQDKLMDSLNNLNLGIIDCRSWSKARFANSHHRPRVVNVLYLEDHNLALPPTKHLDAEDKRRISLRVKAIFDGVQDGFKHKIGFEIIRWLPGVRLTASGHEQLKRQLTGRELCEVAKKKLDEEERSSRMLLETTSRVDAAHDRQHRHKVSFDGDVHQHEADDFDILMDCKKSVSNALKLIEKSETGLWAQSPPPPATTTTPTMSLTHAAESGHATSHDVHGQLNQVANELKRVLSVLSAKERSQSNLRRRHAWPTKLSSRDSSGSHDFLDPMGLYYNHVAGGSSASLGSHVYDHNLPLAAQDQSLYGADAMGLNDRNFMQNSQNNQIMSHPDLRLPSHTSTPQQAEKPRNPSTASNASNAAKTAKSVNSAKVDNNHNNQNNPKHTNVRRDVGYNILASRSNSRLSFPYDSHDTMEPVDPVQQDPRGTASKSRPSHPLQPIESLHSFARASNAQAGLPPRVPKMTLSGAHARHLPLEQTHQTHHPAHHPSHPMDRRVARPGQYEPNERDARDPGRRGNYYKHTSRRKKSSGGRHYKSVRRDSHVPHVPHAPRQSHWSESDSCDGFESSRTRSYSSSTGGSSDWNESCSHSSCRARHHGSSRRKDGHRSDKKRRRDERHSSERYSNHHRHSGRDQRYHRRERKERHEKNDRYDRNFEVNLNNLNHGRNSPLSHGSHASHASHASQASHVSGVRRSNPMHPEHAALDGMDANGGAATAPPIGAEADGKIGMDGMGGSGSASMRSLRSVGSARSARSGRSGWSHGTSADESVDTQVIEFDSNGVDKNVVNGPKKRHSDGNESDVSSSSSDSSSESNESAASQQKSGVHGTGGKKGVVHGKDQTNAREHFDVGVMYDDENEVLMPVAHENENNNGGVKRNEGIVDAMDVVDDNGDDNGDDNAGGQGSQGSQVTEESEEKRIDVVQDGVRYVRVSSRLSIDPISEEADELADDMDDKNGKNGKNEKIGKNENNSNMAKKKIKVRQVKEIDIDIDEAQNSEKEPMMPR